MRQELELAKAELRQGASIAGKAAGMLGGAAVDAFLLVLFLSYALLRLLSAAMDPGWAAVLVAALWGLIAVALYAAGRSRMRELRPMPQTAESVKQMPSALRALHRIGAEHVMSTDTEQNPPRQRPTGRSAAPTGAADRCHQAAMPSTGRS
ncbi:phage holin family protein [Catellatospora sichuanensis]|uniref:phage holin family protein n=1 Tax=Catellatospora sichuanensis TaxID=1969805 RepID=UPI001182FB29|nr:phage holin family protein [Catellatospora sichuanensis]